MNDNQISVHWSDLPKDELTRFCQDVDAGTQGNFLIAPVKKLTRRKRGEHSTKAKWGRLRKRKIKHAKPVAEAVAA